MVAYFDSSAIAKLYIQEAESAQVQALWNECAVIAVNVIGYAETHAAIRRSHLVGRLAEDEYVRVRERFTEEWSEYAQIMVTPQLAVRAAAFVHAFNLRGFDAVHLAAAEELAGLTAEPLVFASFDRRLSDAAKTLQLPTLF